VKAGVDFLTNDAAVMDLPIVAMGTSMGGGVAITAAGELPEIDAVISLSAFANITDLIAHYMTSAGVPDFLAVADIPFFYEYLGFHYGFDKLKYSPLNGVIKLGERPILMMHSTGDSQVPFTEFEKLREGAEKYNIDVTTFIREGDIHFICYDTFFDTPAEDIEFSETILKFLARF
jgi:fermentation-respiration switch protein FrsA (DUF1100 family)